jgi:glycyl-tRNA synthetase (class II)
MKKKYDLKMHKMRSEMEVQLIKNLEEKKDARIAQLTKENSKMYTDPEVRNQRYHFFEGM